MSTVDPHDLTDRLDELAEALRDCGVGDGIAAAEIAEKAIETARQAIAAAEASWRNVIATRQMANDANARLRAVLLAALGETDDGETALLQYVQRLAARVQPDALAGAAPPQIWADLIEGITLLAKGATGADPFHCEHDILTVCVDENAFTLTEIERLEQLGFDKDERDGGFRSFRFGSA